MMHNSTRRTYVRTCTYTYKTLYTASRAMQQQRRRRCALFSPRKPEATSAFFPFLRELKIGWSESSYIASSSESRLFRTTFASASASPATPIHSIRPSVRPRTTTKVAPSRIRPTSRSRVTYVCTCVCTKA